ncbi:MAG TPA: carbamoyltransferase HypF, partial [Anaeromyxobacteraceae bacterium]|nr:carbamoyltransferase HypF [Anaeromyxobacteraceae bacterium]
MDPRDGRRFLLRGTVQGVGMRPFVWRAAREAGVTGRVRNDASGVTVDAFGTPAALDALEARLRAGGPPSARIASFVVTPIPVEPCATFEIEESEAGGGRRVTIPPDLSTCEACRREVLDPSDRRFRYPFANCTDCGPRFTIVRDVPYDRAATTMAPFRMCADCAREYRDPADRRFHAEPVACPACGPRVSLAAPDGSPVASTDPVADAGRALAEGRIVAVKGIGGFHLACDATSSAAVRTLRQRKRREEKPLAVMVPDVEAAGRIARLSAAERDLLASPERPVVLLRLREGGGLAPGISPDAPTVGLLLPYSPLHHLLLAAAGRPLVVTSGNRSEEPIAFRDADALRRLGGIADLFLLHDREIEARADDSVARVVRGRPLVLRRARGFVPAPVRVARPFPRPVLACGAHLKNAVCLASGSEATLGPHVGDLDDLETLRSFEESIERLERFLRVRPALLAHDLHPGYLSTRYAIERAHREGIPAVGVQHHHAHAVAAMAEHALPGPVLALTWDGTGLGTDGTAWGGELLLAREDGFERLATFRPLPLAGGDRAVREPWRLLLAALDDVGDGALPAEAFPAVAAVPPADRAVVRRMVAAGVNAPRAHGAGRIFDVVGALALGRGVARHEGQLAVALDGLADASAEGTYPVAVDTSTTPWQLDWRPTVRAAARDALAGVPAGVLSMRFHRALAEGAAELLRHAGRQAGRLPVVATGGVFQNGLLAALLEERIRGGFDVY